MSNGQQNPFFGPVGYMYQPMDIEKFAKPAEMHQQRYDAAQSALDDAVFDIKARVPDRERADAIEKQLYADVASVQSELDKTGDYNTAARKLKKLNKFYTTGEEIKAIQGNYAAELAHLEEEKTNLKDEPWRYDEVVAASSRVGATNYDASTGSYDAYGLRGRGKDMMSDMMKDVDKLASGGWKHVETIIGGGGKVQLSEFKTKMRHLEQSSSPFKAEEMQKAVIDFLKDSKYKGAFDNDAWWDWEKAKANNPNIGKLMYEDKLEQLNNAIDNTDPKEVGTIAALEEARRNLEEGFTAGGDRFMENIYAQDYVEGKFGDMVDYAIDKYVGVNRVIKGGDVFEDEMGRIRAKEQARIDADNAAAAINTIFTSQHLNKETLAVTPVEEEFQRINEANSSDISKYGFSQNSMVYLQKNIQDNYANMQNLVDQRDALPKDTPNYDARIKEFNDQIKQVKLSNAIQEEKVTTNAQTLLNRMKVKLDALQKERDAAGYDPDGGFQQESTWTETVDGKEVTVKGMKTIIPENSPDAIRLNNEYTDLYDVWNTLQSKLQTGGAGGFLAELNSHQSTGGVLDSKIVTTNTLGEEITPYVENMMTGFWQMGYTDGGRLSTGFQWNPQHVYNLPAEQKNYILKNFGAPENAVIADYQEKVQNYLQGEQRKLDKDFAYRNTMQSFFSGYNQEVGKSVTSERLAIADNKTFDKLSGGMVGQMHELLRESSLGGELNITPVIPDGVAGWKVDDKLKESKNLNLNGMNFHKFYGKDKDGVPVWGLVYDKSITDEKILDILVSQGVNVSRNESNNATVGLNPTLIKNWREENLTKEHFIKAPNTNFSMDNMMLNAGKNLQASKATGQNLPENLKFYGRMELLNDNQMQEAYSTQAADLHTKFLNGSIDEGVMSQGVVHGDGSYKGVNTGMQIRYYKDTKTNLLYATPMQNGVDLTDDGGQVIKINVPVTNIAAEMRYLDNMYGTAPKQYQYQNVIIGD